MGVRSFYFGAILASLAVTLLLLVFCCPVCRLYPSVCAGESQDVQTCSFSGYCQCFFAAIGPIFTLLLHTLASTRGIVFSIVAITVGRYG